MESARRPELPRGTLTLPAPPVRPGDHEVRAYLWELEVLAETARTASAEQRRVMEHRHPPPAALLAVPDGARRWERRPGDADFAVLRAGIGRQALSTTVVVPPVPEGADPGCAEALRRFVDRHATVPGLPIAIDLRAFRTVRLRGDRERAVALARALLAHAAVFHGPEDLRVHAYPAGWEWVETLPHSWDGGPHGAHLVIIADRRTTANVPAHITYLEVADDPRPLAADRTELLIDVGPDGAMTARTPHGAVPLGVADAMTEAEAARVARRLAPRRAEVPARAADAVVALDELLAEAGHGPLRVPIGVSAEGAPVFLDLKQAAEGGDGPHGLVTGATGSGKTELLRTIIAALAWTHPPDAVTVLMIDYMGGSAFDPFARLPHAAGVAVRLAGDDGEEREVGRLRDVIGAELARRRERLRAAGADSRTGYERARAAGAPLEPMPTLLIVCDDATALVTVRPDIMPVFRLVGRVGRALGVHLLLASQRLDEGALRGLDTNLSYRVCQRVFSRAESERVLGVPDAFALPAAPGHGLLRRSGGSPLERFRAAYVSGPRGGGADGVSRTLLDEMIDHLAASAPPARRIWPPHDA